MMKTFFVSSTFKDMQFERDILHKYVIPEINSRAGEYGDEVDVCDLRWGVNTESMDDESRARKVLSVCMDEIDNCAPYMIVLLGQRYGWIPEKEIVQSAAERGGMELDDLDKSVTELEIEYGALQNPERAKNVLFYFRNFAGFCPSFCTVENAEKSQKLAELKARIRKLPGAHIREYTVWWNETNHRLMGLEHLAGMMIEDVTELLRDEWKKILSLPKGEKVRCRQWHIAEQKAKEYRGKITDAEYLIRRLDSGEKLLLIQGQKGSGKSCLSGYLAERLKQKGYQVLPFFCGREGRIYNAFQAAIYVLEFLEVLTGLPHFEPHKFNGAYQILSKLMPAVGNEQEEYDYTDLHETLTKMAEFYTDHNEKKLLIIIDGADLLKDDEMRKRLLFIPGRLSEKIQIVMTCSQMFDIEMLSIQESIRENLDRPVCWKYFNESERKEALESVLQNKKRELGKGVKDRIYLKKEAGKPLYLKLLIQRLAMMDKSDFDKISLLGGGIDSVNRYQLALVEKAADTIGGICREILDEAADKLGGYSIKRALSYIAVSQYGLREKDIFVLLRKKGVNWNALNFSLFAKYMDVFFSRRDDGRYCISYNDLKKEILDESSEAFGIHREFLAYIAELPAHDRVRMEEMPGQCFFCNDENRLTDYLTGYGDDPLVEKYTVAELQYISEHGGAEWICDLIGNAAVNGAGTGFLHCLVSHLLIESYKGLIGVYKGTEYLNLLKNSLSELFQYMFSVKIHDTGIIEEWERFCIGCVYICQKQGDFQQALSYTEQRTKADRYLLRIRGTTDDKRRMIESLISQGEMNLGYSGNRAGEAFREALEILDTVSPQASGTDDYNHLYWRTHIYNLVSKSAQLFMEPAAVKYRVGLENNLEVLEKVDRAVTENEDMQEFLWYLPYIYILNGRLLQRYSDQAEMQRTMELYIRAESIRKQSRMEYFLVMLNLKLKIYINSSIAKIYETSEDSGNLKTALAYCQNNYRILSEMEKWKGTQKDFCTLWSAVYQQLAEIYDSIGSMSDLHKSAELYYKTAEMSERAAEISGRPEDYQTWALLLQKAAGHPMADPLMSRKYAGQIVKAYDRGRLPDNDRCGAVLGWAMDEIYLQGREKYHLANKPLAQIKVPRFHPYRAEKRVDLFLLPVMNAAEYYWKNASIDQLKNQKCELITEMIAGTETLEWMQRCCQKLLHYRTRTKNGIWETGYLFYADFALYLRGMWELFPGKNLLKTTEGCLNPAEYILNWEMKEVSNDLLERSSFIYRTYMLTSLVLWPSRISKNSCLPEEEKQSYSAGALNLIIAMSSAAELFVNIAKRFLKIFVVTDEMKTQLRQYAETVKNKVLHHYKYLCTQRIFMPASVINVIQGMIDSVNL